jgi:hypothetical protein
MPCYFRVTVVKVQPQNLLPDGLVTITLRAKGAAAAAAQAAGIRAQVFALGMA